jgi:hypothetical protein
MITCASSLSQHLTNLSIIGDKLSQHFNANATLQAIVTHQKAQWDLKKIFLNRHPDIEIMFTKIWQNKHIWAALSEGRALSAEQSEQTQQIQAIFSQYFTQKLVEAAYEKTLDAIVTQLESGPVSLHKNLISREGARDEELQRAAALIGDYGQAAVCLQYQAPTVVICLTQESARSFFLDKICPNVWIPLNHLLKDSQDFEVTNVINAICNIFAKYKFTIKLYLDFKLNGDMYEHSCVGIEYSERQNLLPLNALWESSLYY